MNTNTTQKLEQALSWLVDEIQAGVATGKEFALEQAPEVAMVRS